MNKTTAPGIRNVQMFPIQSAFVRGYLRLDDHGK